MMKFFRLMDPASPNFEPACMSRATALLEYTRKHLTTVAMAQYVTRTSKHPDVNRILYLSQDTRPDYLRCLTLHGFKELYGSSCHDYPRIPHLYTDYPADKVSELYGRGITYSRLLDPAAHDASKDDEVVKHITGHYYDVIVYGSAHRGLPYWDLVSRHYAGKDVILLCGEDLHQCELKKFGTTHDIFIREL
jgi:hypothetical protein